MKKIIYIILIVVVLVIGNYLYKNAKKNIQQVDVATTTKSTTTESTSTIPVDNAGATTTKTVTDTVQGISYSYPDNFYFGNSMTQYVHPVDWPLKVVVTTTPFTCKISPNRGDTNGKTELKKIGTNTYCLTTQAEGAAGSTYTTYTYKKQFNKKNVSVTFVTRVPQCMNYDQPRQSACKKEVEDFSIDNMIDGIFSSISFLK